MTPTIFLEGHFFSVRVYCSATTVHGVDAQLKTSRRYDLRRDHARMVRFWNLHRNAAVDKGLISYYHLVTNYLNPTVLPDGVW